LVTVEGDGRDGQSGHENGNGLQRAHHLARDGRIASSGQVYDRISIN
jgi:hypothetical protein